MNALGWCPRRTLSWSGAAPGLFCLDAGRLDLTGQEKDAVDLVEVNSRGKQGVCHPSFTPRLPLTFHSGFMRGENAGVSARGRADVEVKLDVLLQLETLLVVTPRED